MPLPAAAAAAPVAIPWILSAIAAQRKKKDLSFDDSDLGQAFQNTVSKGPMEAFTPEVLQMVLDSKFLQDIIGAEIPGVSNIVQFPGNQVLPGPQGEFAPPEQESFPAQLPELLKSLLGQQEGFGSTPLQREPISTQSPNLPYRQEQLPGTSTLTPEEQKFLNPGFLRAEGGEIAQQGKGEIEPQDIETPEEKAGFATEDLIAAAKKGFYLTEKQWKGLSKAISELGTQDEILLDRPDFHKGVAVWLEGKLKSGDEMQKFAQYFMDESTNLKQATRHVQSLIKEAKSGKMGADEFQSLYDAVVDTTDFEYQAADFMEKERFKAQAAEEQELLTQPQGGEIEDGRKNLRNFRKS